MIGLRKASHQVVQAGSRAAENVNDKLATAGRQVNRGARSAYRSAMNHPKTTTAVVLGTGVAAALLWMMQRNGGFHTVRREVLKRVRG